MKGLSINQNIDKVWNSRVNVGFHERSKFLKKLRIRLIKGGLKPRYWWYRLRWNYYPKFHIVPEFPLHLIIELTNACNLRCIHCSRPIKNEDKMLDYESVKDFIDEAAKYHLPSLLLSYGGEVFLYKHLLRAIEYASDKRCFLEISIVTNGTLVTPENADRILNSGLTQIIFSVDALSSEKYEQIRVGANYERTMNNINHFLRRKRELNKKRPLVRIQMVGMNINQDEIEDFITYWEPKVDMVTVNDYIYSLDSPADFSLDRRFSNKALENKSKNSCAQLWQRFAITANKKISLCNNDYNIGKKGSRSIYEWWHSDELNQIRKAHMQGLLDILEKCRECSFRYL